jgi:S-adenosylmethionine-diacylglycerol 3-amino-3-carboxypropyl transferase
MTLLFDAAFFKYLEQSFSFGDHFAGRVRHALTRIPLSDNPYMTYILLGRYNAEWQLPLYLRKSSFGIIRSRLDRIVPVSGSCEEFFPTLGNSTISKFNFSNIFEWMATQAFADLLRETVRIATPGARVVYRNLLVKRECPDQFAWTIDQHRELAANLLERDRSFIYSKYVVEQIQKRGAEWNSRLSQLKTAPRAKTF